MAGPAATNTDKKILSGKKGVFYSPLFVAAGGMKYQKTAGTRPEKQMTTTSKNMHKHCLPIFQMSHAMRQVFQTADDTLHEIFLQRRAGTPRRGRWRTPPSGQASRGRGAAPETTTNR